MGFVAGCSGKAWASASDAPQKRQNCEPESHAPRHRGHRRWKGWGAGTPRSITRPGAMAGADGGGAGGAAGAAGAAATASMAGSKLGGSGTVRDRSIGGPAGRGAPGCGGVMSKAPQVTQKRIPGWFALPHWGHGGPAGRAAGGGTGAATGGGGGEGSFGAKLTAGAGGRGLIDALPAGLGGSGGARAVAASGESAEAGGERPMGGVGGATLGASR